MENLKVIRTSKQESLTREVELFKDEKQLAQNYINSEGFIFEEADLIPTNLTTLEFDGNLSDTEYFSAQVDFNYLSYQVQNLNGQQITKLQ